MGGLSICRILGHRHASNTHWIRVGHVMWHVFYQIKSQMIWALLEHGQDTIRTQLDIFHVFFFFEFFFIKF